MRRRQFIFGALASGAVVTSAGVWLSIEHHQQPLTIDHTLQTLAQRVHENHQLHGRWNLAQVLIHCAQSVEYSMQGFPQHYSEFFKRTAGKLAFKAFDSKGKMQHNLSEAIPGAPAIDRIQNIDVAYQRLRQSLLAFSTYEGKLAAHFAYGELSKVQYERAHVMHLNNHLSQLVATNPAP